MDDPVPFAEADRLMCAAVADGTFPGGVLLTARRDTVLFFRAYGLADLAERQPVTRHTVFDLASLTKPLATALAVLRLAADGRLTLEDPIGLHLPALGDPHWDEVTVYRLLTHSAGLPDYRPYYQELRRHPPTQRRRRLHDLLANQALVYPPGQRCVYSDLGFMILAWLVEDLSDERLDRFVRREVYEPLGIEGLSFMPLAGERPLRPGMDFAATERCLWRGTLCGQVHDENAWVAGGVAGQAGLFGSAGAVQKLLATLLDLFHGTRVCRQFPFELVRSFLTARTPGGRTPGFDIPAAHGSASGRHFGSAGIGHLGFTGTSFWADLERGLTVILLTNRVHPHRGNTRIRSFRPLLHDAVMAVMEG